MGYYLLRIYGLRTCNLRVSFVSLHCFSQMHEKFFQVQLQLPLLFLWHSSCCANGSTPLLLNKQTPHLTTSPLHLTHQPMSPSPSTPTSLLHSLQTQFQTPLSPPPSTTLSSLTASLTLLLTHPSLSPLSLADLRSSQAEFLRIWEGELEGGGVLPILGLQVLASLTSSLPSVSGTRPPAPSTLEDEKPKLRQTWLFTYSLLPPLLRKLRTEEWPPSTPWLESLLLHLGLSSSDHNSNSNLIQTLTLFSKNAAVVSMHLCSTIVKSGLLSRLGEGKRRVIEVVEWEGMGIRYASQADNDEEWEERGIHVYAFLTGELGRYAQLTGGMREGVELRQALTSIGAPTTSTLPPRLVLESLHAFYASQRASSLPPHSALAFLFKNNVLKYCVKHAQHAPDVVLDFVVGWLLASEDAFESVLKDFEGEEKRALGGVLERVLGEVCVVPEGEGEGRVMLPVILGRVLRIVGEGGYADAVWGEVFECLGREGWVEGGLWRMFLEVLMERDGKELGGLLTEPAAGRLVQRCKSFLPVRSSNRNNIQSIHHHNHPPHSPCQLHPNQLNDRPPHLTTPNLPPPPNPHLHHLQTPPQHPLLLPPPPRPPLLPPPPPHLAPPHSRRLPPPRPALSQKGRAGRDPILPPPNFHKSLRDGTERG